MTSSSVDYDDQRVNDKDVVLSYMNIRAMEFENASKFSPSKEDVASKQEFSNIESTVLSDLTKIVENRCEKGALRGIYIPIITDLGIISNFSKSFSPYIHN